MLERIQFHYGDGGFAVSNVADVAADGGIRLLGIRHYDER